MAKTLGDSNDHFWRMHRMARATGADLVAAFDTPDLLASEYAQMLTRCRACLNPKGCDRVLAGLPDRSDAPDFCNNQKSLARIKAAGHQLQGR